MTWTCPACGKDCDCHQQPLSNRRPPVNLPIPAEMVPVMVGMFRQMSTRMGMQGYGHVANMMTELGKPLLDAMPEELRSFSWDPEAFAQAVQAKRLGWEIIVAHADGRVGIVGHMEGKKPRCFASRGLKKDEDPAAAEAWLEDFFEQIETERKNDDA